VPDLPFCSAHGPTAEAALHEVMIAKELWLESARAHGDPVPEPRYRPALYAAG
jgi:predicted RNase H-like HicB family nuclease